MDFRSAVCDTGPLISALQSSSVYLLTSLFSELHIPSACMAELIEDGWGHELTAFSSVIRAFPVLPNEEKTVDVIAQRIAQHAKSQNRNPARHLGEAQAIALALRKEHQEAFLLLDELAARAVAQELRLQITGFPGVLLLAVQDGMITPSDLADRLEECRAQGTHYSVELIQRVYEIARSGSKAS